MVQYLTEAIPKIIISAGNADDYTRWLNGYADSGWTLKAITGYMHIFEKEVTPEPTTSTYRYD
jgi:hypothetical protein